ncbi:lactose-binding lectin l-2-like [Trichomycterus rosablanca]|uniref:lactose-binding lectin l-2-like n=1 Tax=Trichomycterus rosablanca TaxID=2290929 RepID=UPI002F351AD0
MRESLSGRLEYFALDKPTCLSDLHLGWVTYEKRSFKYVAESMNWASAERHCVNLGANLISIHSEDEYQLVKALIRAHDPSENPTWIGLSDCQELYQWVWSDGTKFNYTKWNPNEPNALNKECCVHMNFAKQKNWNDIPCEIKYPFVCVKKLA